MPIYRNTPWQRIVNVSWSGSGQFFYAKHIKIKSGTGVSISSPYNGNIYPPGPEFDSGIGALDPGFDIEDTGDRITSNSEEISIDNDTDDARHFVIWAMFYAPNLSKPLPTDDQWRGYYSPIFYGGSFASVKAEYDVHGDLLVTTGLPR